MKYWFLLVLLFLLAACSSLSPPQGVPSKPPGGIAPTLPDLGEAPELANEVWLNTDGPLRLSELDGRVILLDMWTYG